MKLSSPRDVATFVALVLGAVMGASYLIYATIQGQYDFLLLSLLIALGFIASYIIVYYSLEYFINNKIRLIYRTIRKNKLGGNDTKEFIMSEDALEKV